MYYNTLPFEVTEEHLKLLSHMYGDLKHGDPKRVHIEKILGTEPEGGYSCDQRERFERLRKETQVVLNLRFYRQIYLGEWL